ncbi:FecCD family ABC transporter permease [Paracoccus sp. p3-h83]|uniref:FecCD family ABC transporter permease n=1 Tax=Paracoccus sp. p3-h83 TaxID=3342805 RepID=UPI0035B997F9
MMAADMRAGLRRDLTIPLSAALAVLCSALLLWSLTVGYVDISAGQALAGLLGRADPQVVTIVQELRLPRAALALIIGGSLGLSGAALQGLFLNPLAEPGVIGVSSAAALGAVITIYTGWAAVLPWALPAGGLGGAMAATLILWLLAARGAERLTLLLVGVAIGGLSVSLISLTMNLSPNPWAISEIAFWLMGSLKDRTLDDLGLAAPFIATGSLLLALSGRGLEALTLGEDAARSLGVSLNRVRAQIVIGVSLCVGAGVAVAGSVGFVGLVVPHLLRPLVGHAPARLLMPAALGGAALLLAADILVRLIAIGPELQLGIVTSLIGTPFFFLLIFRLRDQTW